MVRGRRVFGKRSGEIARKRLKLLLAADKTDCSPDFLGMIKDDIRAVVSKYMDIDPEEIEVGITNTLFHGVPDPVPVFYANIPIRCLSYKGII
ncbi:MAG: cell division topological specificity factor MinE [Hungatella sp.]|jgi:cell division topological specificity factor|nr:cell division topological specificity factor MinE [Hungatella sp.]MCI9502796.1 cell division topological specificity factor MinE [Hungatella sp.]MCI9636066.1 cell division topological specificity factor MinE [Hungatella sp.]